MRSCSRRIHMKMLKGTGYSDNEYNDDEYTNEEYTPLVYKPWFVVLYISTLLVLAALLD